MKIIELIIDEENQENEISAISLVESPAIMENFGGLQGTWKVRFSDAPPPSNGALGPFRGRAFQVVDVDSRTYSNELSVGPLDVKLSATY